MTHHSIILETFAIVYTVAVVSLVAGLLRTASAAAAAVRMPAGEGILAGVDAGVDELAVTRTAKRSA